MRFHDPQWGYALLLAPVLLGIAWWGIARMEKSLERFLSKGTVSRLVSPSVMTRKKVGIAILSLATIVMVGALTRPQYGVKPVKVKRSGIDVMILIDTSKSMNARDIKPSRMERAKIEVSKLISSLEGNRIGLITFAGSSFVESPLTLDASTVKMFLDSVKVGSNPTPGTAIGGAIENAVRAFKGSRVKTKAVILITDGENLSGSVESSAKVAKENGITIFPIGMGSVTGAPIPELSESGEIKSYKKDKSGSNVISKLDEASLAKIAEITGGMLVSSQGERLDTKGLVEKLKGMEKTDITSQEYTKYEERYQLLAFSAFILLLLEYVFVSGRFFSLWRERA